MNNHKSFYLPGSYFDPEGFDPRDDQEDGLNSRQLDHLRDHFSGIMDYLYSKKPLNNEDVDFSMGEIASVLGLEMPATCPTIERMDIRTLSFIDGIKLMG